MSAIHTAIFWGKLLCVISAVPCESSTDDFLPILLEAPAAISITKSNANTVPCESTAYDSLPILLITQVLASTFTPSTSIVSRDSETDYATSQSLPAILVLSSTIRPNIIPVMRDCDRTLCESIKSSLNKAITTIAAKYQTKHFPWSYIPALDFCCVKQASDYVQGTEQINFDYIASDIIQLTQKLRLEKEMGTMTSSMSSYPPKQEVQKLQFIFDSAMINKDPLAHCDNFDVYLTDCANVFAIKDTQHTNLNDAMSCYMIQAQLARPVACTMTDRD